VPDDGAPAIDELTALVVPVALRDGSRVRVRIRQVRPSDEELLSGFEQLGPESRYRRFLSPLPELSRSMVRYPTDVDHHNHEAVVALDDAAENGLGIARYVRDASRPETTEVAVTVIDEWQGRGLGTRARRLGVSPTPANVSCSPSCWACASRTPTGWRSAAI